MPRQNRVTPFGDIVATPDRGTFMGNRGVLHDAGGCIRRPWQVRRWIVCVLEFRGRTRRVMTPGRYTELFSLDEATALAAGHRPCAECRHARFLDFCTAWGRAHPDWRRAARPTAQEIDDRLHAERVGIDRRKPAFEAALDDLPDGVLVAVPALGEGAYLVQCNDLLAWSPGGYQERRRRPKGEGGSGADATLHRGNDPCRLRPRSPSVRRGSGVRVVVGGPPYEDPCFTFRFAADRVVARLHLDGVEVDRPVAVYTIDPGTGERMSFLATGRAGETGD